MRVYVIGEKKENTEFFLYLPFILTHFFRESWGIQSWILHWRKTLKLMPHIQWVPFIFSSPCTRRILTATYLSDQMYIATINYKWIDIDHKSPEITLMRGGLANLDGCLRIDNFPLGFPAKNWSSGSTPECSSLSVVQEILKGSKVKMSILFCLGFLLMVLCFILAHCRD